MKDSSELLTHDRERAEPAVAVGKRVPTGLRGALPARVGSRAWPWGTLSAMGSGRTDRAREARDIVAERAPPRVARTTLSAWISVHRSI